MEHPCPQNLINVITIKHSLHILYTWVPTVFLTCNIFLYTKSVIIAGHEIDTVSTN